MHRSILSFSTRASRILTILGCLFLCLSILTGCDSESLQEDPDPFVPGGLQIGGFDQSDLEGDTFEINSASIVGSSLKMNVSYSGGCEEHEFSLFMHEAMIAIFPPMLSLYAVHDGNGDLCEAYITRDVEIDMSNLFEWLSAPYTMDIYKNDTDRDPISIEMAGSIDMAG